MLWFWVSNRGKFLRGINTRITEEKICESGAGKASNWETSTGRRKFLWVESKNFSFTCEDDDGLLTCRLRLIVKGNIFASKFFFSNKTDFWVFYFLSLIELSPETLVSTCVWLEVFVWGHYSSYLFSTYLVTTVQMIALFYCTFRDCPYKFPCCFICFSEWR